MSGPGMDVTVWQGDCHLPVSPRLSPSRSQTCNAAVGKLRQTHGRSWRHHSPARAQRPPGARSGRWLGHPRRPHCKGRWGVTGCRGCTTPNPTSSPPSSGGHSPQALAAGESHEGAGLPPDPALVVAVLPCALPEQGKVAEPGGPCPCPWVPSCPLLRRQLPPSPAPPEPAPPGWWLQGSLSPLGAPGTHTPGWAPTAAPDEVGSVCQSTMGVTHRQHPRKVHPPPSPTRAAP